MAIIRDPRTGQLIEVPDEQVPGRGLQGRNAPRSLAPVVAPEPVRAPATTRGQGPQPPRAAGTPATGLPTGLQGRNAPAPVLPVAPVAQQPVQALGAQALAAPVMPQQTNGQVLDQDRANLAALVTSQPTFVGPAQGTTLTPDILADANQRIAQTLTTRRQPQTTGAVTPERGVYNVQTVDRDVLAQRAAPTAGLTGLGQFGGQSAADYLATTRAQDQDVATRRQQVGAEARLGLERSALQADAARGTGDARLAARRNLAAFEAQQLQQTQESGATERTGMEVAARQEQARQQAAANVLAAQTQAEGQLGAAQLRGQFGLQEAELTGQLGVQAATQRAAGAVSAAQAGVNPLNQQRAELLATRLRQLNAKIAAGTATDEDFLNFTSTNAAARENAPTSPISGARLTPELEQALQQQELDRLLRTQ